MSVWHRAYRALRDTLGFYLPTLFKVEREIYPLPPDTSTEMGDLIQACIDERNERAPLTIVLHSDVLAVLVHYAAEQRCKPETIAAEAIRAYLGMAR